MIDMWNRGVLVTGAGGGIGAAVARTIATAGGRVVLHDVSADRVRGLAAELGDQALAVATDLAEPRQAEKLWQEAVGWQGRVDVLVNNAGIYEPAEVDGALDAWLVA